MVSAVTTEQIFTENVKMWLYRLGLSRSDFAARLGCSKSYVTNICSGRRSPTLDTVDRIASALGVEPWQLLRETEKTKIFAKKQSLALTSDRKSE